jgi:hypothetical protein
MLMPPLGKQGIHHTDMVAVIDYGADMGLSAPKSQRYHMSVGCHKGHITFLRTDRGRRVLSHLHGRAVALIPVAGSYLLVAILGTRTSLSCRG